MFNYFLILATAASLTAATPERPRRVFIFLDQSGSIAQTQRARWSAIAADAIRSLQCGDSLSVYGVHNNTSLAGRRFHADPPNLAGASGIRRELLCRAALNRMRQEGIATVQAMLANPMRATATDLLSVVELVRTDAVDGRVVAFLFTDALQATSEADIESKPLPSAAIEPLVRRLIEGRRWYTGMLASTEVWFVLNSIEMNAGKPLNSRRVVEDFWSLLIRSLGGTLASFSPDLNVPVPGRSK